MKKSLLICVFAVLLCLSACSAPVADNPGTTETKPTASSVPETNPTESATTATENFEPQPGYFPIPTEPATFTLSSGAGAWSCVIDINTDGTFTGQYEDIEAGSSGEGYKATYYVCDFSGVFANVEKVNSYTYKVVLIDISTAEPVGKEWIENEIRYVASYPCGLYDPDEKQACEDFIVYLPHTPVSELPEEFLGWWPYKNQGKDTLSCYGLMNTITKDGFFYIPEA